MKKEKIIPIRLIPENHDSDWDGVPNYRDCQPFNPHYQDKPKIRKKRDVSDEESFYLWGKDRLVEENEKMDVSDESFHLFGKKRLFEGD